MKTVIYNINKTILKPAIVMKTNKQTKLREKKFYTVSTNDCAANNLKKLSINEIPFLILVSHDIQ